MFTFKHEERIKDGSNDLFRVDKITMFNLDGEEVGYLNLAYIPDELPFYHFLDLKGHRFYAGEGIDNQIFSEEQFSSITDGASRERITYKMAQCCRAFSWNRSNELAKESLLADDFRQFLIDEGLIAALHKEFDGLHQMYTNYFVDRPYVYFIRIHEPFQGKKASIFLYIEASRWLKERNMRLRLSGLVSDQAGRIREIMKEKNLLEPTTWVWYNKTEKGYLMK